VFNLENKALRPIGILLSIHVDTDILDENISYDQMVSQSKKWLEE
jgi:hypothetical protein